jgi:hypothetical protein
MGQTTDELLNESATIDLEMKRVQLELQREQLQEINQRKQSRRIQLESQQRDLAENERQRIIREANCKHKKGGRNKGGLDRGTDSNYAVIQHTMPVGEVIVLCQRCGAIWSNPPIALKKSDPEAYAVAARNYRKALEWPTDNEPSGTQLFLIQRAPQRRYEEEEEEETTAPRASRKPKAARKNTAA